jgi:hypothetical protein
MMSSWRIKEENDLLQLVHGMDVCKALKEKENIRPETLRALFMKWTEWMVEPNYTGPCAGAAVMAILRHEQFQPEESLIQLMLEKEKRSCQLMLIREREWEWRSKNEKRAIEQLFYVKSNVPKGKVL